MKAVARLKRNCERSQRCSVADTEGTEAWKSNMLECHTSFCGRARLSANCNTVIENKSLRQMIQMRLYLKPSLQQGPKFRGHQWWRILKFTLTPVPMQLSWHDAYCLSVGCFFFCWSPIFNPSNWKSLIPLFNTLIFKTYASWICLHSNVWIAELIIPSQQEELLIGDNGSCNPHFLDRLCWEAKCSQVR